MIGLCRAIQSRPLLFKLVAQFMIIGARHGYALHEELEKAVKYWVTLLGLHSDLHTARKGSMHSYDNELRKMQFWSNTAKIICIKVPSGKLGISFYILLL